MNTPLSLGALADRIAALEERDAEVRARAAYATAAIASLAITMEAGFDPGKKSPGTTLKVLANATRTLLVDMALDEEVQRRALEHVVDLESFSHGAHPASVSPRSDA